MTSEVPSVSGKLLPRWFAILMTATHVSWFFIAPRIHERQGNSDEAAWLPLFLFPTLAIGFLIGIAFIARPRPRHAIAFLIVFVVHVGVGLGFHPT